MSEINRIYGRVYECLIGISIVAIVSVNGWFGSRGTITDYTTKYQGKPAIVQHEDIRWGPDQYQILIDGKDKISEGQITDDNKRRIHVNRGLFSNYSVRDAESAENKHDENKDDHFYDDYK